MDGFVKYQINYIPTSRIQLNASENIDENLIITFIIQIMIIQPLLVILIIKVSQK